MPFLRNSPTGQTRRRIFTHDGSNDVQSRKDVHFWGFFTLHPICGSKTPILGCKWAFSSQTREIENVPIIKTTASIPTKFCTVMKTTKCPSWVVPTHALQIQDSGQLPSLKNRKIVISRPRFERFWWNLDYRRSSTLLTVPTVKNLKFRKVKMAAAAILESENRHIWFEWFQQNLTQWRSSYFLTIPIVNNLKF